MVGDPRAVGSVFEASVAFSNAADTSLNFSQSFRYTTESDLAAQAMTRIAALDAPRPAVGDGHVLSLEPLGQTPAPDPAPTVDPNRLRSLILSIGDAATAFHVGPLTAVVDLLNKESVPLDMPVPFTRAELIALLPPETQAALGAYLADNGATAALLNTAIETQNRDDVLFWVGAFTAKGVVTLDQGKTIAARVTQRDETIVSPAVKEFGIGTMITLADVQRLSA